MGEEFNTEQFIQNLWESENLQGLKQVNGKGGYRNGRYFPYQGTNGIDIGPGFLLKSQSPAFQKKARTVGLTKKELDDLVRSSIKESMAVFDKRIRKEGGNPNAISNNVRMGLLDMNWQLGKDQFMGKYNNFWKAVANGDYEGMRRESRTIWTDKKGKHLDKSRWDFRKNTYFQDPEPLVPVVNTPPYIAQPDATMVARPLVPPAVPEVHNVPFIPVAPNAYAEGGMLYGNEEQMPNAPQEEYQDEYQNNDVAPQESPRQWDELSLSEKNAFIASAVKHGITNMGDIRKAYNEISQGQMNAAPEEMEEEGNKFLKGGYKPSRSIRNYIANKEGASMKTNRSFEEEAQSFWNVLPKEVRSKLTQEQADALYSYSYNVGAGNFKHRVVPALQRYFSGIGSMEDVQRHMYATKDSQLRGLANRRAEERAMFAGSKVPVYYDAPNDTPNDAPNVNMNNAWRSSRLGPVNSINVSRGLGVVNNNGFNNNALLGPVNNIRQDAPIMSEAINTLYDDANPTLMEVPQEEQSSLDRYNAIQDYLSSMNPFGYARGGRMYKDGGVTSSNGQYHVEPSEYSEVLDSAANGNPLEVTLPDTTVTAADPRNYRSYYDPDGFMDFANVVTLGLPNRGSVSQDLGLVRDAYDAFKGDKTWGNVGLSAIMGNKGVFDNPYANLALDFAVPMSAYGAAKYVKPRYDFYRAVNEFNEAKPLIQSSSISGLKDYPLRGESQIPLDIKREAAERYSDFIGSEDYLNRLRNAGMEGHWDYMKGLTSRRVNGNGYFPGNVRDVVDNDLEVLGSSEVEPSFIDYGITLKEDLPISEIPLTLNHEMSHWATGNAGKSDIANAVNYPFKYDPDVSKIGDIMRYNEGTVPNIEWEERYKNLPISTTVDEATKAEKEYQYLIDPQEKRARAYSLYQQAKNMNISTDEFVDNYTRNGSITNEAPMELRQMGKILTPKNLKKYLRDFLSLSTPMVLTKTNKNEKYR